jgi:lipopolysaccharide export system permease protein
VLTIFDKYIIKKYLTTFFFSAFLFTLLSVVIDISEKIEAFIESGVPVSQIVTDYYVNFIPWINGILWPLFALLAVVFFTSRLAKNTEIVAALSAGMSFTRLLRPYMIAATTLALIHFVGSHYFIPKGNKTLKGFENTYLDPGNLQTNSENVHIFLDPESKIFIRNYRRTDTSMRGVFLERFEHGELVSLIKAERMKWVGPPGKWTLFDYQIREFKGEKETLVVGKGQSFDTTINLLPKDFVRYSNLREMMTSTEMREFIAYENEKGLGRARKMVTELHRRNADPFTIIVLTLIGVAVASRQSRGGVGVHLALGVSIGALYIILSRFSITFANQLTLPIGISVWLPNIFFTVVALILLVRAQK